MSISFAILGMLTHKDMTGYDIKNAFDSTIKCLWPAHLSQIYRELGKLESSENVISSVEQQDSRPDKKIYKITNKGKSEFLQWLNTSPRNVNTIFKDEVGLRMFFGSQIEKEELIFQLKTFIKNQQETLSYLDNIIESIKNGPFEKEKRFWLFSVSKSYKVLEAEINWAKECISELSSPSI
ncbi:DNA-binding PadR family transcriptional regulator [Ureibacillus xyleni]|uniref:DNA-binding PadR family transcriptional regulator n=1 Tax=Ureibacillus xyleni TaxID=614648 RepID=A0A285T306_9BACL|nr:PadR family transcriptional regulator [Ureibacillus xyleni]SOC15511.1 DNA-binding PadR family transcriptional regulator [Ureibacillus xyleni]